MQLLTHFLYIQLSNILVSVTSLMVLGYLTNFGYSKRSTQDISYQLKSLSIVYVFDIDTERIETTKIITTKQSQG